MSEINLNQAPPADAKRDAIHVPVIPVTAMGTLMAGQPVYVDDYGCAYGNSEFSTKTGIVNPFLLTPVEKGERFWLFLKPGTTTPVRHEWAHPSFPSEDESAELREKLLLSIRNLSEIVGQSVTTGIPKSAEDDDEYIDDCRNCS